MACHCGPGCTRDAPAVGPTEPGRDAGAGRTRQRRTVDEGRSGMGDRRSRRRRVRRGGGVNDRPPAAELLATPGAMLTRSDLRALGLERRAIDAVFRECPVVVLRGYSRPMVSADAYRALIAGSTYCDRCGDRVRPT